MTELADRPIDPTTTSAAPPDDLAALEFHTPLLLRARLAAAPQIVTGVVPGLARFCFRRRRLVVAIWLLVLGLTQLAVSLAGTSYDDQFTLKHTQSAEALALLTSASPASAGDDDKIVFSVTPGTLNDPAVKDRITTVLDIIGRNHNVASVVSPYENPAQVARSAKVAYADVTFDEQASALTKDEIESVAAVAQHIGSDRLHVDLAGDAFEKTNPPSTGGVGIGVALAGIILFLAFGSLLAAAFPLLTALVSLGTGLGAVGLLSHLLPSASFSGELASLIGLGVGVDYALFIITRHRQALARGKSPEEAAVEAVDTAGRAVIFAGITVCIALLGMFALGISFLYGVVVAASLTVLLTVVASVTFLPALLGFAGTRVLSRKERRKLAGDSLTLTEESKGWGAWARRVQKRPGMFAMIATVLMVTLALPTIGIRLGSSDAGSDPSGTTTRRAYDTLATGFGAGSNGPFQLVVDAADIRADNTLATVADRVSTDSDVVSVSPVVTLGGTDGLPRVDMVQVTPQDGPQAASTEALLGRLRHDTAGTPVLVGGETAIISDFSDMVASKLPWFIGLVVLMSSLLLMMVFRSLLIPVTAAIMNLLSAGAAFGIVTAVFQDGWGASLIGAGRTGPIEAFVPVMMFAVLFGLSMDYEVFLLSRIFEELHRRKDNDEAVVHGLAATGRTVSAAAAIMVGVFAAFVLGGDRIIKLFGVGLASAVALDAIVVRALLVPAAMLVFGNANWKMPSWLDRRLPHLNVEGGHHHEVH